MTTNLKFYVPITEELKQQIADCRAEIQREIVAVQRQRDAITAKIADLEATEQQLVSRMDELHPHLAESDEASTNYAGANIRLDAIRRLIAPLREQLNAIKAATLAAAGPVLENIHSLWRTRIDEMVDQAMEELCVSNFASTVVRNSIRVGVKANKFMFYGEPEEATAENIAKLDELFALALAGRVSPKLEETP